MVDFTQPYIESGLNDDFHGPPSKQLVTVLWLVGENTISTLGRIVLLIWLFVVLKINSSYTANLTSILTVQKLSSPITGIESLVNTKESISYQLGSFSRNYLIQELHIDESRLVPLNLPEDYARALKDGPGHGGVAAIVDDRAYVEFFLSMRCQFSILGQEFTKNGWGNDSAWKMLTKHASGVTEKMETESQMMDATTSVGATNIATSSRTNAPPTMAPEKSEKFSGIDFKRWQQKMFFYLTTLCLQQFTSEGAPEVPEETSDKDRFIIVEAWKHSEFLCKNYILSGFQDDLYNVYSGTKTSKELWGALEQKYNTEDAGIKKFLIARFLNFK
ncbi:hypothetical protein FXO38_15815 [Capsicum annuum]|nr:hypothetical protein FXO38_15815 [Capsicum annuum]KAF3676622.1 hypothetical protein FXO37_05221 [Capsicum annuum]